MRSNREEPGDESGEEPLPDGGNSGNPTEPQSVAEAWFSGRLRQAERLLERFASEFDECEAQAPNLLRDYYHWTGEPHYRTDYGWSAGRPEDNDEDPGDVIERVNC